MHTSERIGRKSIGIEDKPTRLDLKISGIMDTDNLSVSEVDDYLRSYRSNVKDQFNLYNRKVI